MRAISPTAQSGAIGPMDRIAGGAGWDDSRGLWLRRQFSHRRAHGPPPAGVSVVEKHCLDDRRDQQRRLVYDDLRVHLIHRRRVSRVWPTRAAGGRR